MAQNNDGSFTPSYMGTQHSYQVDGQSSFFNNYCLRVGSVIGVHYINDSTNRNKKRTEYDVLVLEKNGSGGQVPKRYNRCTLATMLGSVADTFEYTLRSEAATIDPQGNFVTRGASVLILCANGDSDQSYIVGSTKHKLTPVEDPSLGHNLNFEFNGLVASIDKDGELLILRKGATDLDGNTATLTKPSLMNFRSNGIIELSNTNDESGQVIQLDPTQQSLNVLSNNGGVNLTASGFITERAQAINAFTPLFTINNNAGASFPVLIASPAYLAAFNAYCVAAIAACAAQATASTTISVSLPPGTPTTPEPTNAAAAAAWSALGTAIAAYQASVVPVTGISTTTLTT